MGLLVNGTWKDQWYDTEASEGEFIREDAQFRHWITPDGSPGPTGEGGFQAEPDRYHLYVSLACPWASRILIVRKLKKLETLIGLSIVHPDMLGNGWEFHESGFAGVNTRDDLFGAQCLHELYTRANASYSGRVTVPLLWDRKQSTIVSNESADLMCMLNTCFDGIGASRVNLRPDALVPDITHWNERIYHDVNNGVYKAGFATQQSAYEKACRTLFDALDELNERLADRRYLHGDTITETDWRLFTTLVRFDAVYFGHFKCNLRRIADYAHLSGYLRDLYQQPGIAETVHFAHIQRHYYYSHHTINPTRIVPLGPDLNLSQPHDRAAR